MMNRRQMVTGALVVPFALPAAVAGATLPPAPAATSALTDPDAWVRLCAERRMLHQLAEDSVVDGNIPDDVADFCWGRVGEIDNEIAASQPSTARGLRAALVEYLYDVRNFSCDAGWTVSLFQAAITFVDGASA